MIVKVKERQARGRYGFQISLNRPVSGKPRNTFFASASPVRVLYSGDIILKPVPVISKVSEQEGKEKRK